MAGHFSGILESMEAYAERREPATGRRVVLLTRKYPPSVGGMQRWSVELGRALAAEAAASGDGPRRVVEVWAPPALAARGPAPVVAGALALRALAAAGARRGRVALVHLGDAALAPAGPLLRAWLGCRITATAHGLDVTYAARWYQRLVPPALRRLDAVVCVSQATAAACTARGVPVRAVIPNGVDARAWEVRCQRALARQALGLDDGLWLLSVGRLVRRKGLVWFVGEVLPRLTARVPGVRLLVVGDGPERAWIAAAARVAGVADRVRLLGCVGDDALRLAHAAADLFVMPNVAIAGDPEGFGLAALEAAAAGLPVVAAAVDGIPDAVPDGVAGRLAPPGAAAAWAALLADLLADPARRAELGARARAYVRAERDWSCIAAAYWRLFDAVLSARRLVSHEPGAGALARTTKAER